MLMHMMLMLMMLMLMMLMMMMTDADDEFRVRQDVISSRYVDNDAGAVAVMTMTDECYDMLVIPSVSAFVGSNAFTPLAATRLS